MINRKLAILAFGVAILIPILACGTVGVYEPEATQVAMQETVVALQGTISALEDRLNQSETGSPVEAATVTVVPTVTPAAASDSTVIAASSLEQHLQLTDTPTPFAPQPGDQTVILVATLTPTPTPRRYTDAPVLIEPREGTVVEEGREILLRWSWNGLLKSGEHFDIKLRPDGQTRSAYVAWEEGEGHDFTANLAPGRYYWSVQIVKGFYENNSGEPEDRVFEAFLSPESEPRLIIIAKDEDSKRRTPTPTRRPDLNPDSSEGTPDPSPTVTGNEPPDDSDAPDNGTSGEAPDQEPSSEPDDSADNNSTDEDAVTN